MITRKMTDFTFFLALVVLLGVSTQIQGQEYSYFPFDSPPFWSTLFPEQCASSQQSPIKLFSGTCVAPRIADPGLTFTNYDVSPGPMTFINNGHTVQVSIDGTPTAQPSFTGGGFNASYNFAQFHFHWGKHAGPGSEHTLDLIQYPLEMHLVHYRSDFANISLAVDSGEPDALAVIGVLFEYSLIDNANFAPVIDALASIPLYTDTTPINPGVILGRLLPTDREFFFRYSGSLTTPTCNEIVAWTVLKKRVPISIRQLKQFIPLRDRENRPLQNTFRPTQPLNGREVICYKEISDVPFIAGLQTFFHPSNK